MGKFVPQPKTLGGESNLETPVETQADGAPLFRISDLSAGYDKKVVVEGVDLEVRADDVVALIGPNGSGKSTILKTITRHLAPHAGTVELDGREISRWKTAEFARNLAVMLTDRPRTELLTCRDIVEAGRHPYTGRMGTLTPDDHNRVDEAMKTAHVEGLAERDFMQISDGQRQRVMLARAIAQDPRVLVLDEPTSYLDIRYQIDLLRILRHLAKSRNVAVIMSIHELELAQKSADKVICVKDGRVFRAGAPEDIFTRETIGELYGLQHGTFNERFGSVEIGRPHGDAHTFVIAGAGTGSAVFRQLIRQGKAFYAGILHEGDIDCELARDLATECVAERAFEPIGDKTIARAKELLVHCARLIVCPAAFGTINARNAELVEFARSHGIEVMQACEGASEDSHWSGKNKLDFLLRILRLQLLRRRGLQGAGEPREQGFPRRRAQLGLIQARFQTRQTIESQIVGDLRDALDRNRAVRQRPRAIDTDNTRQQKRQIVVEHLVLETLRQQIALGNLVLERRTKTSHKIIERNVLDQLTIEHQVVAQCLVNGFKEGRRRAKSALIGVAVH